MSCLWAAAGTLTVHPAHHLGPTPAVGPAGLGLALQFRAGRHVTQGDWLAVVMVSVSGVLAADAAHVGLGVPHSFSTLLPTRRRVLAVAAARGHPVPCLSTAVTARRRETCYRATAA